MNWVLIVAKCNVNAGSGRTAGKKYSINSSKV